MKLFPRDKGIVYGPELSAAGWVYIGTNLRNCMFLCAQYASSFNPGDYIDYRQYVNNGAILFRSDGSFTIICRDLYRGLNPTVTYNDYDSNWYNPTTGELYVYTYGGVTERVVQIGG